MLPPPVPGCSAAGRSPGSTSTTADAARQIHHPFSIDKMQPNSSGDSIIYRSGMNPKIGRNFEVFSPCELTFVQAVSLRSAHRPHHPAHPGQELPTRALLRMAFQQDAWTAVQADRPRSRGRAGRRCHRRLRVQAPSDPLQEVARTHQESLGSRAAPLPALAPRTERSEIAYPKRIAPKGRPIGPANAHPAPPRIVGSRRARGVGPRPARARRAGHRDLARRSVP